MPICFMSFSAQMSISLLSSSKYSSRSSCSWIPNFLRILYTVMPKNSLVVRSNPLFLSSSTTLSTFWYLILSSIGFQSSRQYQKTPRQERSSLHGADTLNFQSSSLIEQENPAPQGKV